MFFGGGIVLKSPREIEIMAEAGAIVAGAFEHIRPLIRPGVATESVDRAVHGFVASRGGICTFKGYNNFPFDTCISVNEEVVHGFPSGRALREGDIVGIDIGVTYKGYVADSAVTFPVGRITPETAKLLKTARKCLENAIDAAAAGNHIRDISAAVEDCALAAGFSVVRKYVGHGVGRAMHEKPEVPNFVSAGKGARLVPGMTLAIEPMVNAGTYDVLVGENGWTVVTADGAPSAHFEHTVAVTAEGPRVLTRRPGEKDEDF
jgi:methionyl aminopeptidase